MHTNMEPTTEAIQQLRNIADRIEAERKLMFEFLHDVAVLANDLSRPDISTRGANVYHRCMRFLREIEAQGDG